MNIGGAWKGVYHDGVERIAFSATILEDGGVIAGLIEEPDAAARFGIAIAYAALAGRRDGPSVNFRKSYENLPVEHAPILHVGFIAEDGWTIRGRWIIAGERSGFFSMQRVAAPDGLAEAAAEWSLA